MKKDIFHGLSKYDRATSIWCFGGASENFFQAALCSDLETRGISLNLSGRCVQDLYVSQNKAINNTNK